MNDTVLFSERQQFNKFLMWFIFLLTMIPFISIFKGEITPGMSLHGLFTVHIGLVITFTVIVLFSSFLFVLRLETTITSEAVFVRFFPFHLKPRKYKWTEVAQVWVREYNPLWEYGGWGIRGFKGNRAFNTRGRLGIQLVFHNGDRLLIGTNRADEVKQTLSDLEDQKRF